LLSYYLPVSDSVTLHYRDNKAPGHPPLLLLHSLSDNTHAFDGIVAAGLGECFRLVAPDMRGRGNSSRPPSGYTLDHHCRDILRLLDHLGLERVAVAGHSFGALLALYFAAHYPERVSGLTMIDAAAELNPLTPLFLMLFAGRLGKWFRSEDAYIKSVRSAPFITYWDAHMRKTFMADTTGLSDGSLMVKTQKRHIVQCSAGISCIGKQSWRQYALEFDGPALVLSASDPFLNDQHILPVQKAIEMAVLLPGGAHEIVQGNHITMLFGPGAVEIAAQIKDRFAIPARMQSALECGLNS
jgi:pimeloyl-ACP methyl ester carboxylesterase